MIIYRRFVTHIIVCTLETLLTQMSSLTKVFDLKCIRNDKTQRFKSSYLPFDLTTYN